MIGTAYFIDTEYKDWLAGWKFKPDITSSSVHRVGGNSSLSHCSGGERNDTDTIRIERPFRSKPHGGVIRWEVLRFENFHSAVFAP